MKPEAKAEAKTLFDDVPECFNFTHDVVERWGAERPDNLALWWVNEAGTQQRKITFAEMAAAGRRAAQMFADHGIVRGDRVMIILPRVPEWWMVMLGLIRLGAVPIPGTPLLTAKDVAYRLEVAEIKAVVMDAGNAEKVDEAWVGKRFMVGEGKKPEARSQKLEDEISHRQPQTDADREKSPDHPITRSPNSNSPDWICFEKALAATSEQRTFVPTKGSDPGIIYFTSGTTGEAKMVLHSQVSYGLGHTITGKYWLDLKPGEMVWTLADNGWGKAAWSSFYGPWGQGATVFSMDMRGKFDAAVILKTLETYPISVFCAPATAVRLLVRKNLAACRFMALRHCVSAGESLNPPVAEAWKTGTGLTIYEGYGQTEMVCSIGYFRGLGGGLEGTEMRAGSMGRAAPGFDVAIVDEDGRELPAGKTGQIAVRVKPNRPLALFVEYWKNPDETASRYTGDFYLTGDTAYRDRDGYFYFVGRSDDVINSASYRIGPSEVESALQEHPAVLESAAIGVPEEMRGEIVQAYVVLRPGYEASEKLKRELQSHCKRVTAPYKYPRQIVFTRELPKTISGKIRRMELRHRAAVEARKKKARVRRRRKFLRYLVRMRKFLRIGS
ncbi:MAG: AMP-binding protein [Phycisphaerales bacterium]|nr:AMP-binding protein [Phycisphaerales bacterium]